MNKTAIKNYAVWARVQLIEAVRQRAFEYEITEGGENKPDLDSINGRVLSADEKEQRATLIDFIKQKGFAQVMEEAAYTWFNRFIALRFMEVNGYLPSKTRLFTDENNSFKPEILKQAMTVELDGLDREKVYDLLDKQNNEELYKYLLITQCNALNAALPDMFEKIANWTELLFPNNLLKADSVLERMILEIPENDWTEQVEIIGWLYQYYNTEPKDVLINAHKKYKKDDLPFVTQLFTSEWIVKYLVDNSVGRYWIERHPNSPLKNELQFYIDSEDLTTDFENKEITEIKIYDPCIGSGHFLVYAFDVLMKIYKEIGYSERDAAQIIVKNNLYGLDIDNRANQLAFFSVMMKARSFDRRFLTRGIYPNICSIQESNSINTDYYTLFGELQPIAQKLTAEFVDAKIYGSILNLKITAEEITQLDIRYNEIVETVYDNFFDSARQAGLRTLFAPLINQAKIMIQKYDIICTNPPYLNSSYMPDKLKNYVINNYKDYKSDLFAVFIYKTTQTLNKDGYLGILTPYVWMFISSYEKLREYIIKNTNISTLVQLEYNAFEAACVPVCAFVINKTTQNRFGEYIKLSDFKGIENQEPKTLEAINNKNCGYRFTANADNFSKIPGSPIAYWVSDSVFDDFEKGKTLGKFAYPKQGLASADNNRFLKWWFEVCFDKISFNAIDNSLPTKNKWYPHNKGGEFRKWYGNRNYVINWEHNGLELHNFKGAVIRNPNYYFKELSSYSDLTNGNFSIRYYGTGFVFDSTGPSIFNSEEYISTTYLLAVMNSNVINISFLKILCPTMHYTQSAVAKVPILIPNSIDIKERIECYAKENISISILDWDSFETSWDFKKHPFIADRTESTLIADCFNAWEQACNDRFNQLKANEEELNRIFIDIYGLQDELTPEVEDRDVTVRKADLQREIKSLISYAVGCMFGRYSVNAEGLQFAGGDWTTWYDANRQMLTANGYTIDPDNIIPICDDDYFDDDIVGLFVDFVRKTYGEDTLEANLQFIADALGGKGTSREVIRKYFLNEFYKDHCKIYQKRPIYWLFSSGKKNGFKALIYLHRYQPDQLARMRTDYVHEQQERYRTQLQMSEESLSSAAPSEKVKLNKQIAKLKDQALELQKYEEKIHHLADQMIPLDLDDGVKVNYAKFGDVLEKIK